MKNKILFLDVDNTLLFSDDGSDSLEITGEKKRISQKTLQLLKELKNEYYIVLATGRRTSNYLRLKKYVKPDYGILEHGALILEKDVDVEWSQSLKPIIGTLKTRTGILWDYESYLSKELKTESKGRYGSFRLDPTDNPKLTQDDLEQKIQKMPKELTYVRNESFIDVLPKKATKVDAMKYLSRKLKVAWKNTFFVGDDYNDLESLKKVAHPYTHSDAKKEIIDLVKKRKGYVSSYKSFRSINDILLNIKNYRDKE